MGTVGEKRWSRSFEGRNPDTILLGNERIACTYIDDQGNGGSPGPEVTRCFDLDGKERWSVRKVVLRHTLPGGRFLGIGGSRLHVFDAQGSLVEGVRDGSRVLPCNAVSSIRKTRDHLCISNAGEMLVTDMALTLVDRISLPPRGSSVLAGDGIVHFDGERLRFLDRRGRDQLLCDIPIPLVVETVARWEQQTGLAALEGQVSATLRPGADIATELPSVLADPARQTRARVGDRPRRYGWRLKFLETARTLVLANGLAPHVLLCIDLRGRVRWCVYLSPDCCGGPPIELPNGRLVASSGCGGILTWLDPDGRLIAQSTPHAGEGLATAYGDVRGFESSGCIVSGGPGVVAYNADGQHRWTYEPCVSDYDYDEPSGLLVTASWGEQGRKKTVTIECVAGLPLRLGSCARA